MTPLSGLPFGGAVQRSGLPVLGSNIGAIDYKALHFIRASGKPLAVPDYDTVT